MRRIPLLLCCVSAAGLAAVCAARPGWRAFRSWRGRHALEESLRYTREGSAEVALQKAAAAHLLDPDNLGALRHYAELASAAERPEVLELFRRILLCEGACGSDYRRAIEAAAAAGRTDVARQWFDQWAVRLPAGPSERWPAEARLLAAAGDFDASLERLEALERAAPPLPPELLLVRARVLLARQAIGDTEAAAAALLAAGAAPSDAGLDALGLCAGTERIGAETRSRAAAAMLAHPRATPNHRLFALIVRSESGETGDAALRSELAAVLAQPDSPARNHVLAAIAATNKCALVLEVLPAEAAKTQPALLALRCEALLRCGRPGEMLELTSEAGEQGLSAAAGLVYRARAFAALGDRERARGSLRKAGEAATEADLALVERSIAATGDARLRFEFYDRLIENPRATPLARAAALNAAYDLADTAEVRRLLAGLDPAALGAAPELQARCIYLMLLEGIRAGDAARAAEEAFMRSPNAPASRLVLAFANERRGRAEPARLLLRGFDAAQIEDAPSRVMHAAVLGTPPDPAWSERAPLLPSERRLLGLP